MPNKKSHPARNGGWESFFVQILKLQNIFILLNGILQGSNRA